MWPTGASQIQRGFPFLALHENPFLVKYFQDNVDNDSHLAKMKKEILYVPAIKSIG